MPNVARVVIPVPLDGVFDYLVSKEQKVQIGTFVEVSFGKKIYTGLVIEIYSQDGEPSFALKEILKVVPLTKLTAENINFIKWVSDYNLIPLGAVFKFLLPLSLFNTEDKTVNKFKFLQSNNTLKLTEKQDRLLSFLKENPNSAYTENEIKKYVNIGRSVINTLVKYKYASLCKERVCEYDFVINTNRIKLNSLNAEQNAVLNQINSLISASCKPVLLEGITGSGKTEIYFHMIAEYLKTDQQILFLIPEIALSSQLVDRLNTQFGSNIAVWHSNISSAQKRCIWQGILNNKVKVVLGTRSALFLPFNKLCLIIVDEEHDISYKQIENGCYNARDMAVLRAKLNNIPIILGSATPSLESLINVENGKYYKVFLQNRFGKAVFPRVHIVDLKAEKLKTNNCFISRFLLDKMTEHLSAKNQILLFLNKRGYSPIVLCNKCGFKFTCPHCTCTLTNHKNKNKMICHQCGYTTELPHKCPNCGVEDGIVFFGIGVERVEEYIHKIFPDKNTAIITSDTVLNVNNMKNVISNIINRKIDVIIGTQIITKGYNFPDLTLVGVLDADAGLFGGQFKALEKTYQGLTQVIGRVGRAEKPGEAIIQTYSPENIIVKAIKDNNKNTITEFDKQNRQLINLPPYGKMALLIISGRQEQEVYKKSKEIVSIIPYNTNIEVLGPSPAVISKLNNTYRYKLIIKTPSNLNLQKLIKNVLAKISLGSVQVRVDINPYDII